MNRRKAVPHRLPLLASSWRSLRQGRVLVLVLEPRKREQGQVPAREPAPQLLVLDRGPVLRGPAAVPAGQESRGSVCPHPR